MTQDRKTVVGAVEFTAQDVVITKTYNNPEELVTFQLGFHAEYTHSRENLEKLAALVQKYKAPIKRIKSSSYKNLLL